jgi:hypothetical protein
MSPAALPLVSLSLLAAEAAHHEAADLLGNRVIGLQAVEHLAEQGDSITPAVVRSAAVAIEDGDAHRIGA